MKGSVKGVKLKYLLFCFVGVLLVALPLRVYQMFALVESDTGFFNSTDFTVPLLYILLGVFSIAMIALSYISGEIPSPKLPVGKNKPLGVASAILGVGLLWNVAGELASIVENVSSKIHFLGQGDMFARGDVVLILKILAAFAGAIYLFVFCVSHFDGKASYKEQKVLALMPMAWAMCGLVICLMREISYTKVSELMFELCLYVFAMLFFMNFARITSGISYEGVMWQIFGFGLPAAMFGILSSVPRLILVIMGKPLTKDYPFDLATIAVSVFVIIYIFASLGVGFHNTVIESVEEDSDAEDEENNTDDNSYEDEIG